MEIEATAGAPSASIGVRSELALTDVLVSASAGAPSASIGVRSELALTDLSVSAAAGSPSVSLALAVESSISPISVSAFAGKPFTAIDPDFQPPPTTDVTTALLAGVPRHDIRMEFVPTMIEASVSPELPTVQLPKFTETKLRLLISQWENAPNLNALLKLITDYYDEQITDALNAMFRMLNVDTAEGVWLDFLAERWGLTRPSVLASTYSSTFGFDSAGVAFGEARMRDVQAREPLLPIDDQLFRKLIKAKRISGDESTEFQIAPSGARRVRSECWDS